MAKSYSVRFDILGSLDPSLMASIKAAQNNIAALSRLNGKAIAQAQRLSNAQKKLADIEQYKNLQRAVDNANKARAQEIINASRANAQLQRQQKNLADMKKAYKDLQKTQERLKNNALVQKEGVDLARAGLKSAKSSGDVGAIRQAQAALRAQMESARRASQAVKDINAALKQGRAELKTQQAAVRNLGSSFTQSSDRVRALSQQLATQRAQLANLRTSVNAANLGAQEVRLRSEIQATTNALNAEIAALERRNQVTQNFQSSQQRLADAYSNFQNATQTAQNIMSPFKDAAQNAMTFEQAMSKVKSLTQMRNIRAGNTAQIEEEMSALTAQAEALGAATEFTATEIANAMGFYGMAGWDTSQIQAIMQATLDLASIAGDHNIARTADILSDDLSAMGLKAGRQMRLTSGKIVEESQYFADAFAYAITNANLNRESLHEALKYNAPTAHAAGLSMGEAFAMNMVAANAGIKGSMAGTAFRAGWTRFLAPPKTAAKALAEMGLEASDATKAVLETQAALKEIGVAENDSLFNKITKAYQHYQTLDQSQKAGWLKALVGQNALSAWQIAFDTGNVEEIARIAQEIDSGAITGWAGDTAKVMRDNTITEVEYVKSALDAMERSIGQALLPAIREVAAALSPIISGLAQWISQNQAAVQWAFLLAAALSTVIVVGAGLALVSAAIGFISSGLAMLTPIVTALGAAFAFLTSPIFLTVAAIAAVIAIIAVLINHAEQIKTALSNAWNHPQGAIIGFCSLLKSAIGSAIDWVIAKWENLKWALSHPLEAVVNFITGDDAKTASVQSQTVQQMQMPALQAPQMPAIQSPQMPAIQAPQMPALQAPQIKIPEIKLPPVQTPTVQYPTYQPPAIQPPVQPQAEQINVAPIQTAVDTTGQALGQVSMPAQELAAAMPMVPPELNNMTTAAQMTTPELTNVGTSAQMTSPQVTSLGTSSAGAVGYIQALGGVAISASVNIAALSGAASAVAGALQAKAAEIGAIHIQVPQIDVVHRTIAVSDVQTSNAEGGIYGKGAFVTSFAEKSPEAAIPLDRSPRAISLWQQAGSMLGMRQSYSEPNFNVTIHVTITGNADSKDVQRGIEQSLPTVKRSFEEEFYRFEHERARRSYA